MKKLILLAAAAALAGCGSEKSGTFDAGDGEKGSYTVDSANGDTNVTIKTDEGEFAMQSGPGVDAELPDGFKLYPGATVVSNTKIKHNEGSNVSVMMTTPDSADAVLAFYRPQAAAAGIEISTEYKNQASTMIGGQDEAGSAFVLQVTPGSDGETTVNLSLSKKAGG